MAEGRDSGRNVDEMGHYFQVLCMQSNFNLFFFEVIVFKTFTACQGDILLDPSELNGVVNQNRTWPGGEVPYTFWLNEFGNSIPRTYVHLEENFKNSF